MHSYRIDADLKVVEDEHGFGRWSRQSDVYADFKRLEDETEKCRITERIETCARERWFRKQNLQVSYMYIHDHELFYCWSISDGQYLASRLSKSINQESAKLKQLIQQFNALPANSASTVKLSWNDITDLSSFVHPPGLDVGVPRKIRLNAPSHDPKS